MLVGGVAGRQFDAVGRLQCAAAIRPLSPGADESHVGGERADGDSAYQAQQEHRAGLDVGWSVVWRLSVSFVLVRFSSVSLTSNSVVARQIPVVMCSVTLQYVREREMLV